jgi:hypothetical protein
VVRRNADKQRAMERIRRITTPILHIGRDHDHLQGIFQLTHEWMLEAGKDSTWVSFDHPDHGYPFIYAEADGSYAPHPFQQQAFDIFMDYFDRRSASFREGSPGNPFSLIVEGYDPGEDKNVANWEGSSRRGR